MREVREVAIALRAEARATNERRALVLHGDRATDAAASAVADAAGLSPGNATLVSDRDLDLPCERLSLARSGDLLGTTRAAVVLDCRDACRPNALGRAVGAVDGGGLLVVLAPPLETWPDRRDGFDEGLAVPPFDRGDVTGHFRRRLVDLVRRHRGVAVVDCDAGHVEDDGLTDPAPRRASDPPTVPPDDERAFPREVYEACLTDDQVAAVRACESLGESGRAVVLESARGRGKSSAAGLAAAALAREGRDVLVTAPEYRNAAEVFARAGEALAAMSAGFDHDEGRHVVTVRGADGTDTASGGSLPDGGRVRFARPVAAADLPDQPDVVVVDEAAALPVDLLERFLDAPSAAFATTVHGYEGAGRGFDVRFRSRLADAGLAVEAVTLSEPIRFAAGDPVEVWAFRALLLDARPPTEQVLAGATPEDCAYVALSPEELLADEHLLGHVFGLLVSAHYRTEPDDLARLLDGPNVRVRALQYGGRVVSVALLAREGGLSDDRLARMYEGERVRGNMLPDVFVSQLRDERAGRAVGLRVLRVATHHAVRSRGLGSRLLAEIEAEFDGGTDAGAPVDWLGVGYGATPALLRFWARNGYRTVHLSTTRNDASGEHSALMLRPLTDAGRALHGRSARWFLRRVGSMLADPLRALDPDVVRAALAATDETAAPDLGLTDREWRTVASAAFGPGLFDVAPRPFRRLALRHLVEGRVDLAADAERLLVRKVLQAHPWSTVVEGLDYVSRRTCMHALGDAYEPLVEAYGTDAARAEADRYR